MPWISLTFKIRYMILFVFLFFSWNADLPCAIALMLMEMYFPGWFSGYKPQIKQVQYTHCVHAHTHTIFCCILTHSFTQSVHGWVTWPALRCCDYWFYWLMNSGCVGQTLTHCFSSPLIARTQTHTDTLQLHVSEPVTQMIFHLQSRSASIWSSVQWSWRHPWPRRTCTWRLPAGWGSPTCSRRAVWCKTAHGWSWCKTAREVKFVLYVDKPTNPLDQSQCRTV